MKVILGILALVALAGCKSDVTVVESVDGFDLRRAYNECIGKEDDIIEYRIACTAAVYGGSR